MSEESGICKPSLITNLNNGFNALTAPDKNEVGQLYLFIIFASLEVASSGNREIKLIKISSPLDKISALIEALIRSLCFASVSSMSMPLAITPYLRASRSLLKTGV